MSLICRQALPAADRMFNAGAAIVTGALLLLGSGCVPTPPPKPAVKEEPVRTEMAVLVTVKDERGNPLKDAVVYLALREHAPQTHQKALIAIAKGAFHPNVLPVQLGTTITFKNRDRVLHHVYSISTAKKIDVVLGRGASSPSYRLNKAGIVVLGCAIHDRMVGYVYVLENDHFAITGEEGTAELAGLPYRAVDIRLWHPAMTGASEEITKRVLPNPQGRVNADFVVSLQSKAGRKASSPKSPARQR